MSATGFVNWQQYLDANQEAADEMAKRAAAQALQPGVGTLAGAQDVQRNVGLLQTQGGQQAMLQRAYGKAVSPFDAALAGSAGGNYYRQLQQMYGHAGDQMLASQRAEADRRRQALQQSAAQPKTAADVEGVKAAKLKADAQAIRAEDAKRPRGQMGKERWANLHGMSLEQWLERGQQPPF